MEDEDFSNTLMEEALHYNIPESEADTEAVAALDPFFDLAGEYTGIYIYGMDDGLFRAGRFAPAMEDEGFLFF